MRRVPTSPIAHITASQVHVIITTFCTEDSFDPSTPLADTLEEVRSGGRFVNEIARFANEAYARPIPHFYRVIEPLMVISVVEAMRDEFTSTMTFDEAAKIILATDKIDLVASRATNLYHENWGDGIPRAVAG